MMCRLAVLCGLLLVGVRAGAAASSPEELYAGAVVERRLEPGETQLFVVRLREGDYAAIDVAEHGIDVIVRLVGPDDVLIAEQRTIDSRNDRDRIRLIAGASGTFQLQAVANSPAAGSYDMRVLVIRPANESDRNDAMANDVFHRGVRLDDQGKGESQPAALEQYALASKRYAENGDVDGEATSQFRSCRLHYYLGERSEGI